MGTSAKSCRPWFQPRTATILSVPGGRTTVLSGTALWAELNQRPSRGNQVLLESAVEGRQLIKVREWEYSLVALARFDVQRPFRETPHPDRRGIANEHPCRSRLIVGTRQWSFREPSGLGRT